MKTITIFTVSGSGCITAGIFLLICSCKRDEIIATHGEMEKKSVAVETQNAVHKNGSSAQPPLGFEKKKEDWTIRGEGTERVKLLNEATAGIASSELGDWLAEHAMQLTDGDEAFFILLSSRLVKVPPDKLIRSINATTSPILREHLLSAIQEQTCGVLPPADLYALASTLQPNKQRNGLVLSAIAEWLRSDPSLAIGSCGQALDLLKGGDSSLTSAYIILDSVFAEVPKNRRDEVWSLLPSADLRMRSSIAARILEGQYKADSLDASAWLNSLPPSKEKSSAVKMLVSLLLMDNDEQSARIWADSASSYLTPSDRMNIENQIANKITEQMPR